MSPDQKFQIGSKIRKYREELGISQKELAEKASVSASTVSKAEAGEFTPKPDKLQKIAVALGIPLNNLIDTESELEIDVVLGLANIFIERKEYESAISYIKQVELRSDLHDYQKHEIALIKAESLMRSGDSIQAIKILEDLRNKIEEYRTNDHMVANVFNKLGNAYFLTSNMADAHAHYVRAYQVTLNFPFFDELAAKICYNMGRVCSWIHKFSEACDYLIKAETYFRNTSDHNKLADILFTQGLVYRDLERLDMADRYLRESLVLYKAQNLLELVHRVKFNLASSITVKKELALAINELLECADNFEKINSLNYLAYTYIKIAQLYHENGNLKETEYYLQIAVDNIPASLPEIDYNNIFAFHCKIASKLAYSTQDFGECIEMALKSSELFDKIGIKREAADSLEIAVDAYQKLGLADKALTIARRINELLRVSLDVFHYEGGVIS